MLEAKTLESADDMTAAATDPSPITPAQVGVRYCITRGRISAGSGCAMV